MLTICCYRKNGAYVSDLIYISLADCATGNWFWISWEPNGQVTLGQGQTIGTNPLMMFPDASPVTINHVGFTSVTSNNDEWIVPDEFISGPGK